MTILLLDGDTLPALAITRSLGSRGIPVVVASHQKNPIAGYSRYASNILNYPNPLLAPDHFVHWLEDKLAGHQYQLVIPATERTLVPIARHFHSSSHYNRIAAPALDALEIVLDKSRTALLARQCNAPLPASWDITSTEALRSALPELSYPMVIKPGRSISDNSLRTPLSVRYAHSEEELVKVGTELLEHGHLVLQAYFSGIGKGIELIANRGEIVSAFQHQRLHEMPLSGGGSSYRKSVTVDPVLLEVSARLIKQLNWHGVAMVEFKQNPENGEFILIEINGRFWGSLPLAVAAGADFPYQLYQLYTAQPIETKPYRTEIYCRKLSSDLRWLEAVARKDADPRLVTIPALGDAMKDLLKVFSPRHYFDAQSFSDLKPGFVDLWQIVRSYTDRLSGVYREKQFRKGIIKRSRYSLVSDRLSTASHLLFLCYGNINRSAVAHALAEKRIQDTGQYFFKSAGFHPLGNRPADPRMTAIADSEGVPMDHLRSSVLTTELTEWADIIFVMEADHVKQLATFSQAAADKALLLGGLLDDQPAIEIPDPYNKPQPVYQSVYQTIDQCISGLSKLICGRHID